MKKMLVICLVIVILIFSFVSCKNNDLKGSYDTGGVLDLIKANELSCEVIDFKVTDKNENYTRIFVELCISEMEFQKNEYFHNEQYELPPGLISELDDFGIHRDTITNFGINFKDFVIENKNETEFRPYPIYWFKLSKSLQNKSNVVIYASIPYEITIVKTGDSSVS